MKKLFILLFIASLCFSERAAAQNWKDRLREAATEAADKLSDGKLTEKRFIGTWTYLEPALKMESESLLSELAASVLNKNATKRMNRIYEHIGIHPGNGTICLEKDGCFTATNQKHTIKGTYTYDNTTHQITFTFDTKHRKVEPVTGRISLKGENMILVFPVTKLVDLIRSVGERIPQLSGLVSLFDQYKDVYIGFTFSKE